MSAKRRSARHETTGLRGLASSGSPASPNERLVPNPIRSPNASADLSPAEIPDESAPEPGHQSERGPELEPGPKPARLSARRICSLPLRTGASPPYPASPVTSPIPSPAARPNSGPNTNPNKIPAPSPAPSPPTMTRGRAAAQEGRRHHSRSRVPSCCIHAAIFVRAFWAVARSTGAMAGRGGARRRRAAAGTADAR